MKQNEYGQKGYKLINIFVIALMIVGQFGWAVGGAAAEDLDTSGSISGHVYIMDSDDVPIQNARVRVKLNNANNIIATVRTNAEGYYSISGLPPSDYYKVDAMKTGYLTAYYPQSPNWMGAAYVPVSSEGETSGIDIYLPLTDSYIKGMVYFDIDKTIPAANMWVEASTRVGWHLGVSTDENGYYSFSVIGGPWTIFSYNPPYMSEQERVTLESGETIENVDLIMQPFGTISGTVTAASDGSSLANITVGIQEYGGVKVGGACTDASGNYSADMYFGDYIVWAESNEWCSPEQTYKREYWPEKTTSETAIPLTLSADSPNITGINFTLARWDEPEGTPVEAGDNISVSPSTGITVNFDHVDQAGVITALQTDFDPYNLATNYQLHGPVYEISTTAQFTGTNVCFNYDDTGLTTLQESLLKLYQQEDQIWKDFTASDNPDTSANLICGSVSTLGQFAILYSTKPIIQTISAPINPFLVNTAISATATFIDPDLNDTHTATWDWGDGLTSPGIVDDQNQSAIGSHIYTTAGVYTLSIIIEDSTGGSDELPFSYVVIYDPNAGFVTGGGWINSLAGAYQADPSLTGKATFGFVSKYQKGANVPTGNTEFQFKVGNLNFSSTSYDWLVVAGAKAQYKGTGTINGAGNYAFMLTAVDGQINGGGGVDKFRIKIWDKATGQIIYDNMQGAGDTADPATALGGGSIVIHK